MSKIMPDGRIVKQITEPPPLKVNTTRRLGDWLSAFLDYTDMAESPLVYLQWAGLSTICGAAQRKIYCEYEYFFYHSNMYIVLVGPPGSKKSTAIRQGRKLLAKVPGINLTSDAPSVAGIMEEFKEISTQEHQSLNAYISELSTLYENAKESMAGFLTAIYDGDPDYRKRTRQYGKEQVPYPWLNMIAGTTPTWLGDNLTKSMIEGGLIARTIHVFSDEMILQSPRPKGNPKYARLAEDLVHDLTIISQLSGEFRWAEDAGDWYDAWYLNKARFPKVTDNRTAGYYVRKPAHLVKVAMAISMARKNDLILTLDDLQVALAFLDEIETKMPKAFSSVGGNTYANDLERIEAQIKQSGEEGIGYSDLVAANYHALDKKLLDATLEALEAMQTIHHTADGLGQKQYYFGARPRSSRRGGRIVV